MSTETKHKPITGGGTATWFVAPSTPLTAAQSTTWLIGTVPYPVGFVFSPGIPSQHTEASRMNTVMLTAVYQQSGDWWAAWIEELPGANTQGRTIEEARENLREAVQLVLEEGEVPEESHEPLAPGAIRESLTVLA